MVRPAVALVALAAVALAGCGPGHEPIPPGAQQVHVVITESEVGLDPPTARAGDVYLVLDAPPQGSFVFVQRKRTAAETPGPMSDDDLARLAEGDTQWTAIEGISAGGCSAEQDAEARGQMGYCGNVFKMTLTEGKYAVLSDAPEVQPPMAVLEVVP
jgi:hypothetical protein